MNPALAVVAVCAALLLAVVAAARRGWLTRRRAAAGVLLHGAVMATIVAAAYAGTLPDWFRGRGIAHYDTFMHFYLVGLLTFFLETALALPPLRIGRARLPVAALVCCAAALADELLVQPHCAARGVSLHDALGNCAGALLLGWLAMRQQLRPVASCAMISGDAA
ncbi:MAG TPA: hypothetical protein PKM88_07220 [bacterium]|nr:hypothetical protein [bacterium]